MRKDSKIHTPNPIGLGNATDGGGRPTVSTAVATPGTREPA
jgi:hypothetical protein